MPVVLVEKPTAEVTALTLNRPERRNALTIELMSDLVAAVALADSDPKQRVLIIRGAGAAFCAGLDLHEVADRTKAHASAEMVAKTLLTLSQTRLVTIASIHGAAVAGGAGIMSACDFVVAAEGTKIGYPEPKRGLVAGLVMTFIRRQLRERDAKELLLTSELVDAARAREMGLVNQVVAMGDLAGTVEKITGAVLQGAPGALAASKRLIEELWCRSVKDDIDNALRHHMAARESAEAKEGVAAFIEKRPPSWARS